MTRHYFKGTYLLFITILFSLFLVACKKDDSHPDNPPGNGTDNTPGTTFIFGNRENYDIQGTALVTYTDGTTKAANFSKGVLKVPLSGAGNKIVRGITPGNSDMMLIGRKEGDTIKLNFDGNRLYLRTDIYGGPTPIGSFVEFQLVNSDSKTKVGNYTLEADLDLMNEDWVPVDCGEFDGMGHELNNIKIKSTPDIDGTGLFRYANKLRSFTIRSGTITITGLRKGSLRSAGSFSGFAGSITNCTNYATIKVFDVIFTSSLSSGSLYIGGLAGWAKYMRDCHNYGDITVSGKAGNIDVQHLGGIVGNYQPQDELSWILSNCTNYGKIILAYTSLSGRNYAHGLSGVGGIAGNAGSYAMYPLPSGSYTAVAIISDCKNEGDIISNNYYADCLGGIAGIGTVSNSTNTAAIKGGSGIAGYMLAAPSGMAQPNNNKNTGDVIGTISTGGIASYSFAELNNCVNTGNISGKTATGGIAGGCEKRIGNCSNSGKVSGTGTTGGIVGMIFPDDPGTPMYSESLTILNCKNSGAIGGEGVNSIAGICGDVLAGEVIIDSCSNSGNITGVLYVGGLAGGGSAGTYKLITVRNSYNTGMIKGTSYVGGVIGGNEGTNLFANAFASYNSGAVKAVSDFAGGVIGKGNAYSSYNTAGIEGNGKLGGVVGEGKGYQSYNIGGVIGSGNYVGGIIGYATNGGENSYNFWMNVIGDKASYAFGNLPNTYVHQFSDTDWPTLLMGWRVNNEGWKSLGSWNNGNPIYPKLHFQ